MFGRPLFACLACVCVLFLLPVNAGGALELISAKEAGLPNDGTQSRGISRGPKILLINPAPTAGMITSPFNLRMRFESFGGARIDPDSIVVTYKKLPAIDLTQRMRPFIQAGGIELDNAEVPPGEHRIRVEVKDSDGRLGFAEFSFKISN